MFPITPLSKFTRQPNSVLNNMNPFEVLMSHNTPKGVLIKPEIYEKLAQTEIWNEICEEWWEAHDVETKKVVAKGKKMMKKGDYSKVVSFQ